MNELDEGTLAMYALQMLSAEEALAIEAAASADPSLRARIDEAQETMEALAHSLALAPAVQMKGRILGVIQALQQEEQKNGDVPLLHEGSHISDFAALLDRPHLMLPDDAGNCYGIELEKTIERETLLIWLRTSYAEEVHTACVERILILEGTCDVRIGDETVSMVPGEVITIPLHVPHSVRVTSTSRCKALVQRVAA